ncbi:MAG: arginine--tRNA ligase, partial [Patescibacteria group bacterium]
MLTLYVAKQIAYYKIVIRSKIANCFAKILGENSEADVFVPENEVFGHYSTSIALKVAKLKRQNPLTLAENFKSQIEKFDSGLFEKIEIVPPGFINFWLKSEVFRKELEVILKKGEKYGRTDNLRGQKTIVEYTDPNPFKEFHIGHLMSNAIGESIARLLEWNGAEVKRACYQGDVGMHVAKAVWGMMSSQNHDKKPDDSQTLLEKIKYMAGAYALGALVYATDGKMGVEGEGQKKQEIMDVNKKIYDRSDSEINKFYDWGRKASLEYFETIYKKLGTKFDFYFFESEAGEYGK